jgi:hypothetical protein
MAAGLQSMAAILQSMAAALPSIAPRLPSTVEVSPTKASRAQSGAPQATFPPYFSAAGVLRRDRPVHS